MSLKSDFLGNNVTIDDDLLSDQLEQEDLDAADERMYGICRQLGVATNDLLVPTDVYAIKDLIAAIACERRAGLKIGRQPFGQDDAYATKQKHYSARIGELIGRVGVYELTGNAAREDAEFKACGIPLYRG